MFFVLRMVIGGLMVGGLARFFYPGLVAMGWLGTIALGIGGSLVGGWLAQMFSNRTDRPLEPAGCLGSIFGAMLLILIGRTLHLM